MIRIEVVRQEDDLHQEIWVFSYQENRHALVLNSYSRQVRATTRHKFRTVDYWDFYKSGSYGNVTIETIPLPEDVKVEAKERFLSTLEVRK
jgi:hypothetical protein